MSGGRADGEADLTPILDMVFQLITFFMLVINFKTSAFDLSLRLPVVGSARPVDDPNAKDVLILNVNTQGSVIVYGEVRSDIVRFIANEAQASVLAAKKGNSNFEAGQDLPSTVVIRCDKETPFAKLYKVITECQKNGYRKFSLKAMSTAAQ